ncbi:host factor-I protein [Sphingomicrobium lutaoense]|uniref:Host factor-I protein n=1 Tax=Sphingomicrobium lutaoense TaxID=515949 RepID=A0A839Z2A2_9SPHN|nr:host factor-I protein [Sphingomicrobium lutaoense]
MSMYLMKGVRLQGQITGFGSYSLVLRRGGQEQLVYKHSVCSIVPAERPDLELPTHRGDSLQDGFLDRHVDVGMTVFLTNGVLLKGRLVAHDAFSLLLETGEGPQLLFKHAVSTLQPDGKQA